jgi:VWFA-related protein
MPILCATLLTARGQNQPAQSGTQFRTDARLVRLSIVVHDRRGEPVSGLTAADFELFDKGEPQRVSLFSVEDAASRAGSAPPANTISNRVNGPGGTGVTLLLYDRLNTRQEHQTIAKNHVIKYLKQIRPDDRIGLYALDGDYVRVLHDFTDDAGSLLRALDRAGTRASPELAGSEDTLPRGIDTGLENIDLEMERFLIEAEQQIQGFFAERRVRATTGALEGIASHLAGVRGRKNVIWISSGFPIRFGDGIGDRNMAPEVLRATRALSDADIAIYPVDARGLVGAFSTPASARQQQFTTLDGVMRNVESSQVIADQTGGRAYFNTNDLGGAIVRASEDSRLTYVLGYYPAHDQWDGRFRDIKVRVRRSGVQVRHRKGYYALPPEPVRPENRQKDILAALRNPLDAGGVGLSVAFAPGSSRDEFTLTIRVEPEAVVMNSQAGVWTGEVDVAIAQALPDGAFFDTLSRTVPLRLESAEHARLIKEGLTFTRTLSLRSDAHQVKVAVRNGAGAIGTVTLPAPRLRALRPPAPSR